MRVRVRVRVSVRVRVRVRVRARARAGVRVRVRVRGYARVSSTTHITAQDEPSLAHHPAAGVRVR